MNETMKSLQYETKAIDVTEKGIVTVAVNGTGIEDSQHDISMPGSFVDTVRDDIAKMRWFLNHDTRQLLGVPLSGQEKDGNLIMTGQINLNKQIGRDVLEDYKLFAAAGRTLEHSIGVKAVARDEEDRRKVLKWKMFEYSTLTGWGANPNTYLVGIKSATSEQLREYAEFIRMAFKQHGYSDERLKHYDMELNLLLKSLSGGLVVKCPCCGRTFDYEQYAEHTFSQEVQDAAISWLQDVTRRETEVQLEAYRPEIQTEVMSVIDLLKSSPRRALPTCSNTCAVLTAGHACTDPTPSLLNPKAKTPPKDANPKTTKKRSRIKAVSPKTMTMKKKRSRVASLQKSPRRRSGHNSTIQSRNNQ